MEKIKKYKSIIFIVFIIIQILIFNKSCSYAMDNSKTVEDGIYIIKSAINQNYVLDIQEASTSNGANLQIYKANKTNAQKFKVAFLGNGYYSITAFNSGKALDVAYAMKKDSTNVWQYQLNGTDAQKWIIKKNSDNTYSMVSKCNNLYLDIAFGVAKNGQNVQVYTSNNTNAQKFIFEKSSGNNQTSNSIKPEKTIKNGLYTIKSAINSNYVLDIREASVANEANLQIYKSNGTNAQKFYVTVLNDNYYTITAVHSKKVLDVECAGKKIGTNVWQYQSNASNAQQWIIKNNGDNTYSIISRCNNLYLDVSYGVAKNGQNVQVYTSNNTNAQKFIFEETEEKVKPQKTISEGIYIIKSSINRNYVMDIKEASTANGANLQIYKDNGTDAQRFSIKLLNENYYSITSVNSWKSLDVANAGKKPGTNVWQYQSNGTEAQQWIIKKNSDSTYSIISKCNNLYLDVNNGIAQNGQNIQVNKGNNTEAQKFIFEKVRNNVSINTTKYPGYKESIEKLIAAHPNWNFKFLYTGLKFNEAVYGEYSIHSANLVPTSSGSEWICSVCGTKSYDTGWYGASDKAIAYYMDPRNFLNESNIFQFLDVNQCNNASSVEGIQNNVNGTFLEKYANDIYTACKNKNVDPYYVISRLIQENGKAGSVTSKGMKDNNGVTYYNPFNIGASGNSTNEVLANALKKAKANGWDSMRKALEGGIVFLKNNWLGNYQNTLYQNKFDIDSTNGTSLYSHQYMQNLSAAYSEALTLRSYYTKTGKMDANLTFIIPLYENMSSTVSARPSDKVNSEEYPMNVIVNTESSSLALRDGAGTNSNVIARLEKCTVLLSIKRGINSTWQYVVTKDGKVGYMSGEYLKQINDEKKCNYSAYVKTQSSGGVNVRTGPSTTAGFSRVGYLPDYTRITVIDDSTYKGNEGNNWVQWSRIILEDGRQAFVPSSYVYR